MQSHAMLFHINLPWVFNSFPLYLYYPECIIVLYAPCIKPRAQEQVVWYNNYDDMHCNNFKELIIMDALLLLDTAYITLQLLIKCRMLLLVFKFISRLSRISAIQ